jgi:hypothetical protein
MKRSFLLLGVLFLITKGVFAQDSKEALTQMFNSFAKLSLEYEATLEANLAYTNAGLGNTQPVLNTLNKDTTNVYILIRDHSQGILEIIEKTPSLKQRILGDTELAGYLKGLTNLANLAIEAAIYFSVPVYDPEFHANGSKLDSEVLKDQINWLKLLGFYYSTFRRL